MKYLLELIMTENCKNVLAVLSAYYRLYNKNTAVILH